MKTERRTTCWAVKSETAPRGSIRRKASSLAASERVDASAPRSPDGLQGAWLPLGGRVRFTRADSAVCTEGVPAVRGQLRRADEGRAGGRRLSE